MTPTSSIKTVLSAHKKLRVSYFDGFFPTRRCCFFTGGRFAKPINILHDKFSESDSSDSPADSLLIEKKRRPKHEKEKARGNDNDEIKS